MQEENRLRIVTWNVQNLFDIEWQGTEYPEYDPRPNWPEGSAQQNSWKAEAFRYRLKSLAKVLDQLDADILVLNEVESISALQQLNLQLQKTFPNQLLLAQSHHAINIGLLSRPEIRLSLRHELGYAPGSSLAERRQMRAIVEVHLDNGLVLLLNHWKSQRGGFRKTLAQRQQAADFLAQRLEQLQGQYILVIGDFNEPIDSYLRYSDSSFLPVKEAERQKATQKLQISAIAVPQPVLLSPWFAYAQYFQQTQLPEAGLSWDAELQAPALLAQDWPKQLPVSLLPDSLGTYYFRGRWQAIDNIFLCFPSLSQQIPGQTTWHFARFVLPYFAPLLDRGKPQTWQIERMSGLSDHLPIVLEIERSQAKPPLSRQGIAKNSLSILSRRDFQRIPIGADRS